MPPARRFKRWVGLSYTVLLVAVALPAWLALRHAYGAAERRDLIAAEASAAVQQSVRLQETALRLSTAARAYLISGGDAYMEAMRAARSRFVEQVEALGAEPPRADVHEELERIRRAVQEYVAVLDRMVALRGQAGDEPTGELVLMFEQDMVPRQRELGAALADSIALREAREEEERRTAQRAFREALQAASAFVLIGLLAGLGLGVHSARTLAHWYRVQREASRQAQEAVSARDDLLGVVAHDLRSPLAAISLKATSIQRRRELPRAIRDAEAIERIAVRMEALIKSLLDVALIEKGQLVP